MSGTDYRFLEIGNFVQALIKNKDSFVESQKHPNVSCRFLIHLLSKRSGLLPLILILSTLGSHVVANNTGQILLPIQFRQGWNFFSVPVTPEFSDPDSFFEEKNIGHLWSYANGTYHIETSIRANKGYWIYLSDDLDFTFRCPATAQNAQVAQSLQAGWNTIAVTSPVPIPNQAAGTVWHWSNHTYHVATNPLLAGKGYWLNLENRETLEFGSLDADTDNDQIPDFWEQLWGLNVNDPADAVADADTDDLKNLSEFQSGTNPQRGDTDGDSFSDRAEIDRGSNPQDSDELPVTRIQSSPLHGEGDVAITRETIIRFSNPLADAAVVDQNCLFAQFGEEPLAARIHVSPDRRSATLFYEKSLPASSRIRVTLDGSAITDDLGLEIDADGDGSPGGMAIIDFDTLSLTSIPGTSVCGRVFASTLTMNADESVFVNEPLAGVTITVDGMEEELRAVTDQFGDFRLENVPGGSFFVHIDGHTVIDLDAGIRFPDMAYYPTVAKKWESVAGEEINVGEIYLPLIPANTLKPANMDKETVLEFSQEFIEENPDFEGVIVKVPPDSLFSDDGTRGGMIGIAPVDPDRLPGALPDELDIKDVVTIQTDGATNFDEPIPACFPNLDNLAANTKSALWSFNHDTGRFEIMGSMTVSEDGQLVCTDDGVGILAPGWHGTEPGTQGDGGDTNEDDPNDRDEPSPDVPQGGNQNDEDSPSLCVTPNSILLHSGEERLDRVDLAIPGRGDIHYEMSRRYRSRLTYNGPMGFGWDFNYNEGLFIQDNGDVVRNTGGSDVDRWKRQEDGSYMAPLGHFRKLIRQEDGTFILREADGFQRCYRADGRLSCHQDRFGNRMLFDHDARGNLKRVIDVYGREIQYEFETFPDGVDRLVRIIDFYDREVVYTYDGNGDLTAVRTPIVTGTSTGNDFPFGRSERYTYSSGFSEPQLNHNLLSVTFPEEVANGGPPGLQWTYGENPNDPITFDRVLTETEGGTNASGIVAGGTMTLQYEMLNESEPPGQPDLPRGKATITERNGNIWEYFVNEFQHHIISRRLTRGFRDNEPAFYETRSFFNDDGLLLRRVFPEGNEVRYTYDSNGSRFQQQNVIEIRQIKDDNRGGGEDLVTTMTYEPLYNQVSTSTDPRGNASNFTPPLGAASADRYTTKFFYDYQESTETIELAEVFDIDLSGIARDLGDINSDGRIDQVAGNLIRVEAPPVLLRADSKEAEQRGGDTSQEIITETQWNDHGQQIAIIDPEGNVTEFHYNPETDPDGDGETILSAYIPLLRASNTNGYLQRQVVDARQSPRRTAAAAPVALETQYRYDPIGNTIAITNPRGVVTDIEVNQLNEPVVITRGAEVSEAVNSGQLLEDDEEPFQYRTRTHYDFNGRVIHTEVENRDSNTEGVGDFVDHTRTYDILDNVVESTVEVDADTILVTQYRYDENELPTEVIQPEGNITRTTYDERNLPFTITQGFGSVDASTIRIDYDLNANRQSQIDAEDNDDNGEPETTEFIYDGFDRLIEAVDALGNRSVTTYDVASNPIRTQTFGHPPGQPAAQSVLLSDVFSRHDELNRVFQVDEALFMSNGFNPIRAPDLLDENADGVVTSQVEYDALSRSTFVIEDDGEVTQTVYDGASRSIETIDAIGNRLITEYDQNSNPVKGISIEISSEALVADEEFTTHYVYDQLDRLVRMTDNAGQTSRFSYDSRDNRIFTSDAEASEIEDPLGLFPGNINTPGNTCTTIYDGLDRTVHEVCDLRQGASGDNPLDLSNATNPDGQVTLSYEYDGNSRLTAIIDDNNNRTSFQYDDLDRRIRHTNADTTTFVYTFDRDHNVTRIVDPNGSIVIKSYDVLNRLTLCNVTRASGVGGTTQETYEYDGLSRLTKCTDDNGAPGTVQTCERVYDSLSRMLEEQQNGQPVSYVFTGDGKRIKCTYPGGREIENTFDLIDRVKTTRDGNGQIAASDYIGPGMRELRRTNGNGTVYSFLNDTGDQDIGYDAVKRITRLRHFLPGSTAFIDREYGYNRANQRTLEKRNDDFGSTDTYTYDSIYRITSTKLDQAGTEGATTRDLSQIDYTFDGVGNRRQVDHTTTSAGLTTTPYTINEMNEYTSIANGHRSHSNNGNLLDDGGNPSVGAGSRRRLYIYDYKNRLIAVNRAEDNAPIATYLYYCDNRRSKKSAFDLNSPGSVAKETHYFYDGWQVCEEQNADDETELTYVYSTVYIDEPVQLERTETHALGAGTFYYHQNARADVVAITDADSSVVEKRFYDDFGRSYNESKQRANLSTVGNPYGFQGRRLDSESGLYYFRNRYYDPETGRFLQRDPAWDSSNFGNQYSFVGNGVVSRNDPLGLETEAEKYMEKRIKKHANDLNKIAESRVNQEITKYLKKQGKKKLALGLKGAGLASAFLSINDTVNDLLDLGRRLSKLKKLRKDTRQLKEYNKGAAERLAEAQLQQLEEDNERSKRCMIKKWNRELKREGEKRKRQRKKKREEESMESDRMWKRDYDRRQNAAWERRSVDRRLKEWIEWKKRDPTKRRVPKNWHRRGPPRWIQP